VFCILILTLDADQSSFIEFGEIEDDVVKTDPLNIKLK